MLRYFWGTKSKKEAKKKLYNTFVEIFFSHVPVMYKVILDTAGFALQFRQIK